MTNKKEKEESPYKIVFGVIKYPDGKTSHYVYGDLGIKIW